MFLSKDGIRELICLVAAWAECPWDFWCRNKGGLPWNVWRCGVYLVTISASPLRPNFPIKVWFAWHATTATARALLLLAAQVEVSGLPPWALCVVVAGTMIAAGQPLNTIRSMHYKALAVIHGWAFFAGILGGNKKAGHGPLRWMMIALSLLEVAYFTWGWEWRLWWMFPAAQSVVKLGAWLYARWAEKP